MHLTMRKYRQLKGTPEAAVVWVKKNLMPILKKAKGFKAYYAVEFDDKASRSTKNSGFDRCGYRS